MARDVDEVRKKIEKTLGFVPGFLKELTFENSQADLVWQLNKHYNLEESNIPPKYKALIGYAVAAAIHCPYCIPFHKTAAELSGAAEIELQEAALHAFNVSGFSAFLHGREYPLDTFKKELAQIKQNLMSQTKKR
jgi:AhpD family alkylhydroperoxidase